MNEASNRTIEIWTAKERAQLLRSIAVLPDPYRTAESLSVASLIALADAVRDRLGGYKLPRSERDTRACKQLVAAGIVESGWGGIGTFGMLVRREAIAMLDEREEAE